MNHFLMNDITKRHKDYNNYNNLIEFFNYKTAIIGIIQNKMHSINNETIEKIINYLY